jgi:signal transduction histidine kinase
MICIHGQDDRELAQALLSVSRRSDAIGARLCFVGSEATLERAREVARDLDPSGLQGICFRPLRGAGATVEAAAWREAVDDVLAAIRPPANETRRTVAWVEAPVPEDASGAELLDLVRAVRATPAPHAVLGAFELGRLSPAARASLFDACGTVVRARVLLPDCPSWFLHGYGGSPETDLAALGGSAAEKVTTLGQLGAIIAHELGNPLSIISSSLQYLQDRLVRSHDPASEFASAALANVDRIQVLLHKMLQTGTPGKAAFERASLNELVPELLRLTASECERRSVTVEVAFDERIPPAWLDPQGVKQVVLNLLKNGLDALGTKGGILRAHTHLGAGGDSMSLEIENDGPPIERDVFPHLFRPFHSTKVGGTGLGLYLSRQIARDHGGELAAENLPERGVRFTLTLPIDRRKGGDLGPHPDRR